MHLQPKPLSEYPWYLRRLYKKQLKNYGKVLLPGLFWGRLPCLQILFLIFWRFLDRKSSTLEPSLRALCQIQVARLNACKFCVDFNTLNLLKRTNSLNKVDSLDNWQTEQVSLTYVEVVSGTNIQVSNELMNQLKKHFSEDQIVELTALISFQNMSAKFNAALDIPSQGLCKLPNKRST